MVTKQVNKIRNELTGIVQSVDNLNDTKMHIFVVFIYFCSSILRSIPAGQINLMVRYWDELYYFSYAKSFATDFSFNVRNITLPFTKVIYSILISPFIVLFKDSQYQITAICVFNAFLICSSVFPIYLLIRRMIERRSVQIFVLVLSMSLPIFSINLNILLENIFIPESFWMFYAIYEYFYIDIQAKKKKSINAVIIGVGLAFAYITKDIAGFIVVAFIFAVGYDFICEAKDRASKFKYAILSGLSFLIIYMIWGCIQRSLFPVSVDSSGSGAFRNLSTINQWCYFVYAIVLSFMTAVIAMGYFPVLLPFFSLEKFSKPNKVYAIFSGSLLLVNTVGVAYLIIINETPLALEFVHQYRYCEHLAINFIIVFIVCLQYINKIELTEKKKFLLVLINTIAICIFFFVFRFSENGILLNRYRLEGLLKFDSNIPVQAGEFYVQPSLLFFKILAIAFCCVILYLYLKKRWRLFSVFAIVLVMLFYNINTNRIFANIYVSIIDSFHLDSLIPQAIEMNQYCNNFLDGNILKVIDKDFGASAALFDTYMQTTEYLTTTDLLKEVSTEEGIIDLRKNSIRTTAHSEQETSIAIYEDVNEFDYVITDGSVKIGEDDAFRINVEGAPDLYLYELKNKSFFRPIYYNSEFFPVNVGEMHEEVWAKGNLYTQGDVLEHGVISTQGTCTLIYGPYRTIKPGKYNIDFYYSVEDCDDGAAIAGVVDICAEKGQVILGKTDIILEQGVASIQDIEILQEYSDAEVRMTTYLDGIRFDKVIITKVE